MKAYWRYGSTQSATRQKMGVGFTPRPPYLWEIGTYFSVCLARSLRHFTNHANPAHGINSVKRGIKGRYFLYDTITDIAHETCQDTALLCNSDLNKHDYCSGHDHPCFFQTQCSTKWMLLLSRVKNDISEQTVHNVEITILILQFLVKMYRTRIYHYFTSFYTRVYTYS